MDGDEEGAEVAAGAVSPAGAEGDAEAIMRHRRGIVGIADEEEWPTANSIAYTKNYTAVFDAVYKREAVSTCLDSPRRMARAGRNAKEIMVPKVEVTGLGDYTRNVGYKTGSITYGFETKTINIDYGQARGRRDVRRGDGRAMPLVI